MDVKVKDLGDAVNQLTQIENTISDIANLLQLQKSMVTASFTNKLKVLAEVFTFPKGDLEPERNTSIDLSKANPLQVQKGLENLISNYGLMDMLLDLESQVKGITTYVQLNFADAVDLPQVLAKVEGIRTKLQAQKQSVVSFLKEVAKGALPPSFSKFVFSIAQTLSKLLSIEENRYKVSYTLTPYGDSLMYAAYIELRNLERNVPQNEELEVVPKTYITLLWLIDTSSSHSDVHVALTYNWQPADELFTNGSIKLGSTSDATSIVDSLIREERIAVKDQKTAEPVVTLRGRISSLSVEPDHVEATVYSMKEPSMQTKLYMSIPKLFGTGAKYTGTVTGNKMVFDLISRGESKRYTDDEIREFMSWGLELQQVYKIETILLS